MNTTPPPANLTTMERVVLSACEAHPQPAKVIARKCQRSLNRVREAIASLTAKGLLERMARWEIRRCPQRPQHSTTDPASAALALLKLAVQLLSQAQATVDGERRDAA